MAATIADVARAAGVSVSTVSYALSGRRPISAATRERIEASIRELGYRPHAGARSLASRRTQVLGLVAPLRTDLYVPVIMQFVAAVATAARAHDHDVLLVTKDEGPAGLERIAGGAMVDGLIVMDIERQDPRLQVLGDLGIPAVLIGLPDDHAGLSCVDLDFVAAGRLAVEHLAAHGHRSVALVGAPPAVYERGTSYAARFGEGFASAAADLGLASVSVACDPTREAAAGCLAEIDAALPEVTGLVVHNESVLPAILELLRASGRRVPADVSVVGVAPDNVALGDPLPLTSINIPADEVGTLAVAMMAGLLAGREGHTQLVAPTLTERGSCGAPGGPRTGSRAEAAHK